MATRTSRRSAPRRPAPAARPQAPRAPRGRRLLLAAVLAMATAWAYSTSFAGVFVFDDRFGIVENPNMRALWPLTRSMWAPPERPVTARPVASFSLALNYALAPSDVRDVMSPGGPGDPPDITTRFLENVWGYHFMNLVLHVLAAAALMGVVRRTLASPRLAPLFGASAQPIALAVALLWAVHPLTTDAVTYVVQRTEVLMGLLYLLTLYCAIRSAEALGRARAWWITGAVASCALGMGSKQTMVTAPLLVWLWDWTFGRDHQPSGDVRSGDQRARLVLYVGLSATWLLLAALVAAERWPTSIGFDREGWTPWTYLLTQTGVIVHYVRLSFVPWPLVLDYDGWPMARSVLDVWPQALGLTALFLGTLALIRRRSPWGFAGGWFFALLAPSSSVLPLATEIAAERRMYLPLAAIVAGTVVSAYLVGRRSVARAASARGSAALAAGLVAVTTLALGAMTRDRNRDFWSEVRIWQDTIDKRPANPRARMNYGVVLMHARRLPEAEEQLREAVRLKEASAPAHASLGTLLCATGRLGECLTHLERAVALDPNYKDAYASLGEAYGAQGQRALAIKYFALAADAAPGNPFLLNRLGWLLATSPEAGLRDGPRAVQLAQRSVSLTARRNVMSLETLAAAYAEVGRFEEAAAEGREALALAQQQGEAGLREMADRVALYQQRQPYRSR